MCQRWDAGEQYAACAGREHNIVQKTKRGTLMAPGRRGEKIARARAPREKTRTPRARARRRCCIKRADGTQHTHTHRIQHATCALRLSQPTGVPPKPTTLTLTHVAVHPSACACDRPCTRGRGLSIPFWGWKLRCTPRHSHTQLEQAAPAEKTVEARRVGVRSSLVLMIPRASASLLAVWRSWNP